MKANNTFPCKTEKCDQYINTEQNTMKCEIYDKRRQYRQQQRPTCHIIILFHMEKCNI